eukprot:m.543106 g.543106  ORF g.543106 m.543106 type:complete len:774 (+) comp22125_c0_seq7:288-2609(+)
MSVETGLLVASYPASATSVEAPDGFTPLHQSQSAYSSPEIAPHYSISASAIVLRAGSKDFTGFFAIVPSAFVRPFSSVVPRTIPKIIQTSHRGASASPCVNRCIASNIHMKLTTDGRNWCVVDPIVTELKTAQSSLFKRIVSDGSWEHTSTTDAAADIAVLFCDGAVEGNCDTMRHLRECLDVTLGSTPCGCCTGASVSTPVSVVCTPYGAFDPHVFMNTVTSGIVSNILSASAAERVHPTALAVPTHSASTPSSARSHNSAIATRNMPTDAMLFIIDASCHPGSAGAPVCCRLPNTGRDPPATDDGGALLGMVLPPLVRRDGLVMELSLVLPWCAMLRAVQTWAQWRRSVAPDGVSRQCCSAMVAPAAGGTGFRRRAHGAHSTKALAAAVEALPPAGSRAVSTAIALAQSATVLLSSASSWGTGVLVDAQHGIVLTNAHLLAHSRATRFRARLGAAGAPEAASLSHVAALQHRWFEVAVLYVSATFLDIAVVQLHLTPWNALPLHWALTPDLSAGAMRQGRYQAVVAGFPSYPPYITGSPTVTRGVATMQQSHAPTPFVLTPNHGHPACRAAQEQGKVSDEAIACAADESAADGCGPGPAVQRSRKYTGVRDRVPGGAGSWLHTNAVYQGCTDAILLTSASVHPGSSGGPVVNLATGKLLGIVTSFSQCCDEDGAVASAHPTLNFAIPVRLLGAVWEFIAGGCSDTSILCRLAKIGAQCDGEHLQEDSCTPFDAKVSTPSSLVPAGKKLPVSQFWPAVSVPAQEESQLVSKL